MVGNVSGRYGPAAISLGGSYFRTQGISAFDEALGGKERDGYRQASGNAKVVMTLAANLTLDLRGYFSDERVGIDGFAPPTYAFGDTLESARTTQYFGYAGLNWTLLDGRFHNRFGFAYSDTERHNTDPGAVPPTPFTFDSKGKLERFEYQGSFDVGKPLTLAFGAETERSTLRVFSPQFDLVPTNAAVRISSGYAQAIVRPVDGITLTGGVRHDAHDTFGGETTFGGNVAVTPNHGATLFRATYAEGFKAPTLYQLLGQYGNTALRPERAQSYDIGVEQRAVRGRIVAGITYFDRITRNRIDFIFCGPSDPPGICVNRPDGTYNNIVRARAQGVETTIALKPTDAFDLSAQYTHIIATNRSPGADCGNTLTYRPRDSASVIADYHTHIGLSFGGTVTMVASSYVDAANSRTLGGYVLTDIRAALTLRKGVALYGRIETSSTRPTKPSISTELSAVLFMEASD